MYIIFLILTLILYFKFGYRLVPSAKISIGVIIFFIGLLILWYTIDFLGIVILILVFGIGVYILSISTDKKEEQEIIRWKKHKFQNFDSFTFSKIIENSCNSDFIRYKNGDIPYNRMIYFTSGSTENNDSDRVFPIYYHAYGSKKSVNFEEHGFLVTTAEIIVKKYKLSDKKDGNDTLELFIPFHNIYKVNMDSKDNVIVYYADKTTKHITLLTKEESTLIFQIINIAINSGWTSIVRNNITDNNYENNEQLEKIEKTTDFVKNKLDVNLKMQLFTEMMTDSIILKDGLQEITSNQINDRFGDGQGHGHVGEQAGNVLDRFKLKNAQPLGNSHEENGADRIVNGQLIQTKYCTTAGKSISQCFKNGQAKYITSNGNMMKIEVPRDQYSKAVKLMEKRISNGEVPNETNPNNAYKYVKKGALTYEQANIATKSIFERNSTIQVRDAKGNVLRDNNGNIITRTVTFQEKLLISAGLDFATGVSIAFPTSVVSSVWVYCNNRWRGISNNEALKNSLIALIKPIMFSGFTYMLSSQFVRSPLGNTIAKSLYGEIGKKSTNAMLKGSMLTITTIITVGPDLTRALRGRISWGQLIKNTAVTGGGIAAGMALGSFVPIVGTVAGGVFGGFIAKKIADTFLEDDAILMLQIAKEEFIDTILMSGLTKEEFEDSLNKTFLHKNFGVFLQEMYSTGDDARKFVRTTFTNLINEYYNNRELPTEEEIIDLITTEKIISK